MVITHKRTDDSFSPFLSPRGMKPRRGGVTGRLYNSLFFLSLFKAQRKCKFHLSVNSSNLCWDSCLRTDEWDNPNARHMTRGKGLCELCATLTVSGLKEPGEVSAFFFFFFSPAPQSNNQELDPEKGDVFLHLCAFVCRAVVNTFSAFFFLLFFFRFCRPLTLNLYTVPSALRGL